MATYIVKSGDTLSKLAGQYGTTVSQIAKDNNISNVNLIKVGQKLNIGSSTPTPSVSSSSVSQYDINKYRETLNNLTKTSTPAYVPPKTTAITYSTPSQPKQSSTYKVPEAPKQPQSQATPTPTPTATPTGGSHVVVAGDTLGAIAQRNGMTVQQLQSLNPEITNPNVIRVGQAIKLGGSGGSGAGSPSYGTQPQQSAPATVTPEQQREQQNIDLAKKAGEAGLSVTEYQALMQSQNAVTKEETDRIAQELGITALEGEVFKKPKESTQKMFDKAYKVAGLADLKKQIEAINADIDKDRADLAEATGAIDENPFLTETSRVGRGKRVLDQAEAKINNKLAQAKTLQDLYDSGIGEITSMIARDKEDFGTNQAIDQAKLNYLIKKAEIEATQLQTSRDSSSATSSYLNARSTSEKPEVIGTSETGYYKYDKTTQKFVQVIAPTPKSSSGDDPYEFKPSAGDKALVGRFLNTPEGKALYNGQTLTTADLNAINSDPVLFYAVLQKANENGIY